MTINIMIADDHAMVREGLKQLLELDGSMKVIAEAGDGFECLEKLPKYNPDVLLLDINMPKLNGLSVLEKMKSAHLHIPTIVLTVHSEIEYLLRAVEIGINGYMLKDSSLSELKSAIYAVYFGETYIQPSLTPMLSNRLDQRSSDKELIKELTKRELSVLKLLSLGKTNQEISEQLDISEQTVKNHVTKIFKKIGVIDRTQAAVFSIRNHLVDLYKDMNE